MPPTQTKIAAAMTLAALGGVGAAALTSGADSSTAGSDATGGAATPVVQTIIERRTVHRVKHVTVTDSGAAKRKSTSVKAAGTPSAPPAAAPAVVTPPPARQVPVTQPISVRAAAPTPRKPVTSSSGSPSSAGNGGGYESDDRGEIERGDD